MPILNKYKHWGFKLKPLENNYWDFVLSKDLSSYVGCNSSLTTHCLSAYINFADKACYKNNFVHSYYDYTWDKAINESEENSGKNTIKNIGLTGIDNGLIYYGGWDKISNEQFFDILTKSVLEISTGNTTLTLFPITGNTMLHSYDMFENEDSIAFNGGFFQGFFKLEGYKYQVLPTFIEDEWNFEFTLRPRDYKEKGDTLNSLYPENKGIFFYIGTRAENKFCELYGTDLSDYEKRKKNNYSALTDCEYFAENDYLKKGDDYYKKNISLSGKTVVTENGINANENGYYEISTDNKFLTFNRTKNGFTTDTWEEGMEIVLTGSTKDIRNDNLFLLMNRTKNGYTVDTIQNYYEEEHKNDYDILKDIKNNAFCLKYNDDGSISYKYLVLNCPESTEEKSWKILSEHTLSGLVTPNEWNTINVKFQLLGHNDCKPATTHKMKMYIYVNGYLKFVSQELPEFNFYSLDENYSKQEGVPYNISIGGGTQGLCDSVWLDYAKAFEYILPLEQNFAGTFIGDIKTFKFYTCPLQYQEIKNNFLYEKNRIKKVFI